MFLFLCESVLFGFFPTPTPARQSRPKTHSSPNYQNSKTWGFSTKKSASDFFICFISWAGLWKQAKAAWGQLPFSPVPPPKNLQHLCFSAPTPTGRGVEPLGL
jgi:hypothetical protein